MRENFEDAFYWFCDLMEEAWYTIKAMLRCLIFVTLPVWVIPYAIIKKIKEAKDNG